MKIYFWAPNLSVRFLGPYLPIGGSELMIGTDGFGRYRKDKEDGKKMVSIASYLS